MGILNATPDSFSDGGRFLDLEAAVEHARTLIREGADFLDIGGESTRPGHAPVPLAEELARVVPVIEQIRRFSDVPLSVDTSKPAVARAALIAGADIVNDVTACRAPEMPAVLAEFRAGCVLMDDRVLAAGADAVRCVREYLVSRRNALAVECGLPDEAFLLDPGIGFGKSLKQNLQCVRHVAEFADGASGALLGVSRKSFLGILSGEESPDGRLPGTLAAAVLSCGAQALRVHDVLAHRQALLVAEAILSEPYSRHD